ncbi:DNA alkylation repair protein [Flavobacterium taihuense]|uniref:DNA alkylation repair protein n=1 Tax=Flavobacterium taihuense TaxID=2857508 RepID=A0ABS6Y025_9FLAO|nr:DNA alkylation repair protein [Flavobacterium taihuense]MBW4362291.1 DNA alkylation repair protein [Flavobacterium taihuense]
MIFISSLEKAFAIKSNAGNAVAMSKYMRNNFLFFGIKTEERRRILKAIWAVNQREVSDNTREIALLLYSKKERELQYCALEIVIKNLKNNYIREDILLIEKLIITNSWWDSVDVIAKFILGDYLQKFPLETDFVIARFSNSANIWLNRSAILFQLGYKEKTNFDLLKSICEKHKTSNEFFIQKAIGWALREYAKTNPEAVRNFVSCSDLKKLSKKEALKNIK